MGYCSKTGRNEEKKGKKKFFQCSYSCLVVPGQSHLYLFASAVLYTWSHRGSPCFFLWQHLPFQPPPFCLPCYVATDGVQRRECGVLQSLPWDGIGWERIAACRDQWLLRERGKLKWASSVGNRPWKAVLYLWSSWTNADWIHQPSFTMYKNTCFNWCPSTPHLVCMLIF